MNDGETNLTSNLNPFCKVGGGGNRNDGETSLTSTQRPCLMTAQ